MALERTVIKKLIPIFLGAIIIFPVYLAVDTAGSNTFDAKDAYSQITLEKGQIKNDSDFNEGSDLNKAAASLDLTGTWTCDDGGKYYIRQIGNTLAWLGESLDQSSTSVAFGEIDGNTAALRWMDVPKGDGSGSGTLTLNIESGSKITLLKETGGFSGRLWTRPDSYAISDLKMAEKKIDINKINTSPLERDHKWPDLTMSSNLKAPTNGIELVSLNPQPEPPKPLIDPSKSIGNGLL